MEPVINIQEKIGKTVGRRTAIRNPLAITESETRAAKRAWRKAFPIPFVPKGVFCFKSHEEADAWMLKMICRPQTTKGN